MSATHSDWLEEQQRVEHVVEEIGKRMSVLQERVGEKKADIVDVRKHFWDELSISLDDADAIDETFYSIKQQEQMLSEKERSYRLAAKQLATLERLKQSPYFGRIDFEEDGVNESESIYIGLSSLLDESELFFLVYDWRAPISSLFYDYSPGPAQYDTPNGTIRGIMKDKRQYIIRNGKLEGMFDSAVTIGDELLRELLGKRADTHMKSIVSTIQKEQNRVIRNEKSRLLIVQGAAGSGKTSAALQRIAYLLYRFRETLSADQIVLFSPNPIFNSYISTVLPELGEENMQQTTFLEYLEHRIGDTFRLEDPFEQMEYTLTAVNDAGFGARMDGIRYKSSTDFLQVIDRYIDSLGRAGMIFKDVVFREEVLISADQIVAQFYSYDPSIRIPNRMKLLSDWLLTKLDDCEERQRSKRWVEDEIQLLEKEEYAWAYKELRRQRRFTQHSFDDFDREYDFLAEKVVEAHFHPLRGWVEQLKFVDLPAVYSSLFDTSRHSIPLVESSEFPGRWAEICEQTVEKLVRRELAYEDATPFLYVKEKIEGYHTNRSVRHVFIDEAQDYSPFQFAFISRLFPRSKMTVLGDFNQAIFPNAAGIGGGGFASAAEWPDTAEAESFVLPRSYRSTRQIVEFTRELLLDGSGIVPFEREGAKPTVTHAADSEDLVQNIAARIQNLLSAGHRTIAVICKTAKESKEAFKLLRSFLPITLITKDSGSFAPGVLVIPSYLAKGVEFDAAVIYNASAEQYGREEERKLLYTVCTRAMHELHVFFTGEMSPFLAGAGKETFAFVD